MFESWVGDIRYKKVKRLIHEERRKLLAGEFDGLLQLSRERDELVNMLVESQMLTLSQAKSLKTLAERNRRYLASVLDGIRAAREGVSEKNSEISSTYDENGNRVKSGQAVSERDIRA